MRGISHGLSAIVFSLTVERSEAPLEGAAMLAPVFLEVGWKVSVADSKVVCAGSVEEAFATDWEDSKGTVCRTCGEGVLQMALQELETWRQLWPM